MSWVPVGQDPRAKLWLSKYYIKPFADPRFPTVRAVEVYVRIDLSEPVTTEVTGTAYDQIVSHNVYYCGSAHFALVERDYFQRGSWVLKERGPIEATLAAPPGYDAVRLITPDSLDASAAKAECGPI